MDGFLGSIQNKTRLIEIFLFLFGLLVASKTLFKRYKKSIYPTRLVNTILGVVTFIVVFVEAENYAFENVRIFIVTLYI